MPEKRFTDEQIAFALRQAESGTFYAWKARYGGMEVSDARRLEALEGEARARHRFERRAERTRS